MVESVEGDSRGILRPRAGLERFTLDRFDPSPSVARFVDRYWVVSWDLPAPESYEQQVLVHPVVNIVFDGARATVSGISRKRFTRILSGRGRALGVMFRPAGFRPFLGGPLSTLTDVVAPLADILPSWAGDTLLAEVAGEVAAKELAALADTTLLGLVPAAPQPSELTTTWAERAATDRTLHRVEDLAAAVGVGVRRLQRAFQSDVGIGPKWILRRYRLYEAAERAARDERVDWATLAADLGYADQAHLTREFTATIGQPPALYTRAAK